MPFPLILSTSQKGEGRLERVWQQAWSWIPDKWPTLLNAYCLVTEPGIGETQKAAFDKQTLPVLGFGACIKLFSPFGMPFLSS